MKKTIVLVLPVFVGIFLMFYGIDSQYILNDESLIAISAMKFHRENFVAGSEYVAEHPPIAKWVIGLPSIFIESNYEILKAIPFNMFVWNYLAYEAIKDTYVSFRLMSALFGTVSIIFVFLIGKELYNLETGLWAATLASLSSDLIIYSRLVFMDIYMIAFTLGALYFYIKFIKNEKNYLNLILFLIFLFLALGSRQLQPLLLVGILAVSYFLTIKGSKSWLFKCCLFVFYLAFTYIVSFFTYPTRLQEFAKQAFGISEGLVGFNVHYVMFSIIFRNSYIFLLSMILFVLFIKDHWKKILKGLKGEYIDNVLFVFLIVSFSFFSFTRLGNVMRYLIFIFVPLFILGGLSIYTYTKKYPKLNILAGTIMIISIYCIVSFYPLYMNYSNFNLEQFRSIDGNFEIEMTTKALEEFKTERTIVTNYLPLLIYRNNTIPTPPSIKEFCNEDNINYLAGLNPIIVHLGEANNYFCTPLFNKTTEIKFLK